MKIMIDSEYLDKLQKSLGVDKEGNAVVGKNLEVDGGASFLGKEVKVLNFYTHEGSNDIFQGYFIGYCEKDTSDPEETIFYINGIFADSENDGMYAVYDSFRDYKAVYDITEDKIILTEDGKAELINYAIPSGPFKTLFGNQSIVGEGNIDLYRHRITVSNPEVLTTTPINSLTFEYISSNPLICDSLQDLRELMHATTSTMVYAFGYFSNQPYTPGRLAISASSAQITFNSSPVLVTKVEDTVTTI